MMAIEIAEQPAVWQRVLAEGQPQIAAVAARLVERAPRFVLFAARGSSDHAALYGKYLIEITHNLPAGLVSPSTVTIYGSRPDLRDVLMIAISQSGSSPDLVRTIEVARAQGATTLSITNDVDSPLAQVAELHLELLAGQERSVAATKSYTAQLLVLYLLLERLKDRNGLAATDLPSLGRSLLAREGELEQAAARYESTQRMVITSRGYSYATAMEAALKLMETSYLGAQAFSGADLLHGPLAMIDAQLPLIVILPAGPAGRALREPLSVLARQGASIFCIGNQPRLTGFSLPNVADELEPILQALPVQLLALHLAILRGENPDAPRGLTKVTRTL